MIVIEMYASGPQDEFLQFPSPLSTDFHVLCNRDMLNPLWMLADVVCTPSSDREGKVKFSLSLSREPRLPFALTADVMQQTHFHISFRKEMRCE